MLSLFFAPNDSKKDSVSFTIIVFLKCFFLEIIAPIAPALKALLTKLCPSLFFPLIAKNKLFFLISLELIQILSK